MKNLPIVILAGGKNSRFFPLNYSDHKGLITLHGRSLVDRQLENLAKNGFKNIILIHNPKTSPKNLKVIKQNADKQQINLTFLLQKEAKGMGDALLQAKDRLKTSFGVCSLYHIHAGSIFTKLLASKTPISLLAVKTDHPEDFGVLKLADGKAFGVVEKPSQEDAPSNLRLQSIYILNNSFLQTLIGEESAEYSFESALNKTLASTSSEYVLLEKPLVSLKYPWRLFGINKDLFSFEQTAISETTKIAKTAILDDSHGPIIIEDNASIGHTSKIVGPAYIGKNTTVGDFSIIRQSTLEEDVRVGVHADIARSILLKNASFHGFGFIGDSIIGESVKIGAGFITANKRFDRKNIKVHVKAKLVDVGSNAHGTVIGQNTAVGVRTTIMPGVYIGANNQIYPHAQVKRNLPHVLESS